MNSPDINRHRLVCVINNYNYEQFLSDCLDSAINQTHHFDAIYVVDDGSTDGSRKLLDNFESLHKEITVIHKSNGGQLSCFNELVPHIDDSDWVFFLDSDDVYPLNYVEQVVETILTEKSDFYYSNAVRFTPDSQPLADAKISDEAPVVLPLTSAITIASHAWIGSPTSALVVSGKLYRQILPYPFEHDWITCVDDLFILASSTIGAKKVKLPGVGVGYRIHGKNLYAGTALTKEQLVVRTFRRNRLFNYYTRKFFISPKLDIRGYRRELSLLDKETIKKASIRSLWRVISRRIRGRIQ